MLTVLQGTQTHTPRVRSAAELLDMALHALGSRLDATDTDEGHERIATELNAAVLEAIIYVGSTERVAAVKHWQWDAQRSRFAAWAGKDHTFSLSVRITLGRDHATASVALGPFYVGVGIP